MTFNKLKILKKLIDNSKRPVILAGTGISISNTEKELFKFVKKLNIPLVTAWSHDIFPNFDNLYYGRQGSIGNRVGNYVVQYADLVIVLGSRLSIRQTSYNWKSFAKNASIVSIDIDKLEQAKNLIYYNLKISINLKTFFKQTKKIKFKKKMT